MKKIDVLKMLSLPDYEFLKYYKKSSLNYHKNESNNKVVKKYVGNKIYFKNYSRFPHIRLERPKTDYLLKTLLNRRTRRNFKKYKMRLTEISYLLEGGSQVRKKPFRYYPSAGALYPLEIYLIILNAKDFQRGLYHFYVKEHSIEFMWEINIKDLEKVFPWQKFLLKASVIFIITAKVNRGLWKYGERYFRYVLIESGHLAQNILILASNKNLKTCPIGAFNEANLLKILDIYEDELELPIYCLAVGR